jgi:hypothetical protein
MKLIYAMLAASFFVMCETAPTEVTKPIQELVHPAPPPPVCIHQNCFERISGLNCDHGGYYCARYTVQYEHHCDCDQWAPAQKDAN